MIEGVRDARSGEFCLAARITLPRFGSQSFILFQLDERVDSTVIMPRDVMNLDIPWSQCPPREAPVTVDEAVLPCGETDAVIFFADEHGRAWGYRTRVAIVSPDAMGEAGENALSRLGRDVRRRLRIEPGKDSEAIITPLSSDFGDDLHELD